MKTIIILALVFIMGIVVYWRFKRRSNSSIASNPMGGGIGGGNDNDDDVKIPILIL